MSATLIDRPSSVSLAATATERCPLPADRILDAYTAGNPALLVTGRSLYDLVADPSGGVLTALEDLRRRAHLHQGMATITYSLANGLDWDSARIDDRRDRETIETVLRAHRLLDVKAGDDEVVQIMRGVSSLARTPTTGLTWAGGGPLRFLILLEFVEHLTPDGDRAGRTDSETRSVELAALLGQSNALREAGNLIVFHGREGRSDLLVSSALTTLHVAQPALPEKRQFLAAASRIYTNARPGTGLTADMMARLTANTPNRGLEGRLRASHRSGTPVTATELLEQKSRDVVSLSEGTLTLLDARRVAGLQLVGKNICGPLELLMTFGDGLLRGNTHIPANVILAGPPGTGKTDLAILVAERANVSAYQIHSPKDGIVGETERKARLLTNALATWTPNVGFIDEVSEALPMQRHDFDGDSGASRAVTAALLTALSDETRRGQSLVIGTTNCPWRIGHAMRTRFTMIPVLSPLREDYPAIIAAIAARLAPAEPIDQSTLIEAATLFHAKGASAREIRAELSLSVLAAGRLDPAVVLDAARNLCPTADRESAEFADLWAIRACSSKRYLPWHGDPANYPFPEHLADLVDSATGDVDVHGLDARLAALQARVNL